MPGKHRTTKKNRTILEVHIYTAETYFVLILPLKFISTRIQNPEPIILSNRPSDPILIKMYLSPENYFNEAVRQVRIETYLVASSEDRRGEGEMLLH